MKIVAIWVMCIILCLDVFGEVADIDRKNGTNYKALIGFGIRFLELIAFLICMGVFARWQ